MFAMNISRLDTPCVERRGEAMGGFSVSILPSSTRFQGWLCWRDVVACGECICVLYVGVQSHVLIMVGEWRRGGEVR